MKAEPMRATQGQQEWTPVSELRQSLLLLALTVSSMGAYLGIAAAAVRLVSVVR